MQHDLDELIHEHSPFVWRVLLHLGVPDRQLEDLSQEVLLVVCQKISAFEGRSSLRSWIYAICRNVARANFARNAGRREVFGVEPQLLDRADAPDVSLWLRQARAELLRALDTLDPEQRSVFVLYEIEEMSMEEVAAALAAPLTTCYSRLHVARTKVEALMRRRERLGPRIVSGGSR